jgi:flagellum-specific ATP synthase
VPPEFVQLAAEARDVLATYREAEDLITIGAYKPGQNKRVDRAVAVIDRLNGFLRQRSHEPSTLEQSWSELAEILQQAPESDH